MAKGVEDPENGFTSLFQILSAFISPLSNDPSYFLDFTLSTFRLLNDIKQYRFLYSKVVSVCIWGASTSLYTITTSPHKRSISLKTVSARKGVMSEVFYNRILILNLVGKQS
jgi:hypothetical protein